MYQSLNPADECSRRIEMHSFELNYRWLSDGQKFLLQPEDQWPAQKIGNIQFELTCDQASLIFFVAAGRYA